MPLDHYVSQVHLKNFYSPALGELMYAVKKSDLKLFQCNSKSVCRIESGNTNPYLKDERAIEDFLRDVEPAYNPSVSKLQMNEIDQKAIYTIAGFAAYVTCCAPAAMRIHSEPLKGVLESTAVILDRQNLLSKAPPSLGSKSLPELLADGTVHFTIDPKYPQALGIDTIIGRIAIWGNSKWEILINDNSDSPFLTSDFPVAIEETNDWRVLNRIVPLTPSLAIRIIPDIALSGTKPGLSFEKFTYRMRKLQRHEIIEINRLIVRSAEDMIFYNDDHEWIAGFVAKNCHYRIEGMCDRVPYGRGFLNISTQRIKPRIAV